MEGETCKNLHAGHRGRLREKFMRNGFDGFLDYEIVELLLTIGTPRRDCKAVAKSAVQKFGSLRGVMDAPPEDLMEIAGIGPMNAFGLKLFAKLSERLAKEGLPAKITLDSAAKVAQYLQSRIGREKKEHFIALYLDTRHRLIHEETVSIGTLNASLVHPREVFKPAIAKHAAGLIVAHNHPSGALEPSLADLELTKRLQDTAGLIGISLLDHLIITADGYINIMN